MRLFLPQVPNTDWHCPSCVERIQRREANAREQFNLKLDSSSAENCRQRTLEEELVNIVIDKKVGGVDKDPLPQLKVVRSFPVAFTSFSLFIDLF
jgi:hypothetical protein